MEKQNIINIVLAGVLVLATLLEGFSLEKYEAATSYTNARDFYESTYESGDNAHAEAANGCFYFATYAKKASSSTNLKYRTIGFDVSLSANGYEVAFATKVGVSMTEVPGSKVDTGTHIYMLYCIDRDFLYEIGGLVNSSAMEKIKKADVIDIKVDAIMTLVKGSNQYGSIEEDGKGGIIESSSKYVYHLKNDSDLQELKDIFFGHEFLSDKNIKRKLNNYTLTLKYQTGSDVTVSGGYRVKNGLIVKNNIPYTESYNVMEDFTLLSANTLNPTKIGYHLNDGNEWKTDDGRTFSDSTFYAPTDIDPLVGFKNRTATLIMNWQQNEYTVSYSAAGGSGTVPTTNYRYDNTEKEYLAENTFTRPGYYLPEGKEWVDAEGNTYASGQEIHNLTAEHKKNIVLSANWQQSVVAIQTDPRGGTGGTEVFYEKYGSGFYSASDCLNAINTILIPERTGYNFEGYFDNFFGYDEPIVDKEGVICVENTFFTKNSRVYGYWVPKEYPVIFDRQGGIYGSESATATYNEPFPNAEAPDRTGFTFMGYYTEPNGQGECIYNALMVSDKIYTYTEEKGITLYAYWVDDITPDVMLNVSHNTWTNQPVTLIASARDFGSGLSSLQLYVIDADGSEALVTEKTGLGGISSADMSFVNTIEGVVRYKAVAIDVKGNTAEYYNVVYYDKTAPGGTVTSIEIDGNTFYIEVDVSDVNVE